MWKSEDPLSSPSWVSSSPCGLWVIERRAFGLEASPFTHRAISLARFSVLLFHFLVYIYFYFMFYLFILMSVSPGLPGYIFVCHAHAPCSRRSEEDTLSPVTGVT